MSGMGARGATDEMIHGAGTDSGTAVQQLLEAAAAASASAAVAAAASSDEPVAAATTTTATATQPFHVGMAAYRDDGAAAAKSELASWALADTAELTTQPAAAAAGRRQRASSATAAEAAGSSVASAAAAAGSAAAAAAAVPSASSTDGAMTSLRPSRSHHFGAGHRKRTATAAAAAIMASKSNKQSSASASSFPPPGTRAYGTVPFRWYNTLDESTPLHFLFIERNVLHPSARANLERTAKARQRLGAAADNWGCDCPDGACQPATCPCAQHGRNQYRRNGGMQTDTQPQSYVECWDLCSCACSPQSAASAGLSLTAAAAASAASFSSPSPSPSPPDALMADAPSVEWQADDRDTTASPSPPLNDSPVPPASASAPAPYPAIIGEHIVSLAGPVPRVIRSLSDLSPDEAGTGAVGQRMYTHAAESAEATVVPHVNAEVARMDAIADAAAAAAAENQLAALSAASSSSSSAALAHANGARNSSTGAASSSPSPPPPVRFSRSSPGGCLNRVVQRAPVNPSFRLAVFKTGDKGWALKTLTRIPKFSYVCEYVGEVVHEHLTELRGVQLAKRKRSNYLFTPTVAPRSDAPASTGEQQYDVDTESFTIDSSLQGHLSRFINHSCSPNLISTCVYVEAHRDEVRLPRVALFAARTIEPGTELCMHYGIDNDLMQREFYCRCSWCKGREALAMQTAALAEAMQATTQGDKGHNSKKQKRAHPNTTSASPSPSPLEPEPEPGPVPVPVPVPVLAPPIAGSDVKMKVDAEQQKQQQSVFDPLSPVPLPPSLMLDASIPLPTATEIADPSSVFFGSNGSSNKRPESDECVSGRGRKSLLFAEGLSSHAAYLSHLRNLVGPRKCVPVGDSCCLVHVHPSRVSFACFVLQCAWKGSVAWHEAQLEFMRREEEEKAEAKAQAAPAVLAAPVTVKKEETGVKVETNLGLSSTNGSIEAADSGQEPPSPSLPERVFWCGLCDRYFASRLQLCAHRTGHVPMHRCERCGMLFHSTQRLAIHQARGSVERSLAPVANPLAPPDSHSQNPHVTRTRQRVAPNEVGPLLNPPLDSLVPRARRNHHSASSKPAPAGSASHINLQSARASAAAAAAAVKVPRPPLKVTLLHFKGAPVRIIDWPLSFDQTGAAAAAVAPGSSTPALSVLSTDLCERLLGLSYTVKRSFVGTLAPPLCVRIPTGAMNRALGKNGGGTSVCLTLAGAQHTLTTYAQELLARPGLKLFVERVLLPVLGGLLPQQQGPHSAEEPFPSRRIAVKKEGGARKTAAPTRQRVYLDSSDSLGAAAAATTARAAAGGGIPGAGSGAGAVRASRTSNVSAMTDVPEPQWADQEQGDEEEEEESDVHQPGGRHKSAHNGAAVAASAHAPGGRNAPVNLVSPPPPFDGPYRTSAACSTDVVLLATHTRGGGSEAQGATKREQKQQINPRALHRNTQAHLSPPPATGNPARSVPLSSLSSLSSPPPLRLQAGSGGVDGRAAAANVRSSMPSSTPSSPAPAQDREYEEEEVEKEAGEGPDWTNAAPHAEVETEPRDEEEEDYEDYEEEPGARDFQDQDQEWEPVRAHSDDDDEEGDEPEGGDSASDDDAYDDGVRVPRRSGTRAHARSSVSSRDHAYSGHHPGRMARSDRVLRHSSSHPSPTPTPPRAPRVNTSSRRSGGASAPGGSSSRFSCLCGATFALESDLVAHFALCEYVNDDV